MDKFGVTLMSDNKGQSVRRISVSTCNVVCSKLIDIEVEGDIIRKVIFTGGCHGNTQGLSALLVGMKVKDAIARLDGIDCRGRGTSCPDQLARALKLL